MSPARRSRFLRYQLRSAPCRGRFRSADRAARGVLTPRYPSFSLLLNKQTWNQTDSRFVVLSSTDYYSTIYCCTTYYSAISDHHWQEDTHNWEATQRTTNEWVDPKSISVVLPVVTVIQSLIPLSASISESSASLPTSLGLKG